MNLLGDPKFDQGHRQQDAISTVVVSGDSESKPEPTWVRGAPRTQYERTYVLLPANCPGNWMTAAARTTLTFQVTLGFSADDAGIGDLDARTVIAVNPNDIGTGLSAAWYAEHYPGVNYIAIIANTASELEQRLYNLLERR